MGKHLFLGREKEISRFKELYEKNVATLGVVKGRRRIGKSRFIEQCAKGKRFLQFAGLAPLKGVSAQMQRDNFAKQLGDQLGLPGLKADDWGDLFTLLVKHVDSGQVLILFDEITWMASKDITFLPKLKNAWDLHFSKNSKLILILCGSVSMWIEKHIIKSTAFFGRISYYATLEELPLPDCNRFFDGYHFRGSVYEKFILLSVLGGIPWYLEQVRSDLSAAENIRQLCFLKNSVLVKEFNLIFHDLFTRNNEIYRRIIEVMVNGPVELGDICSKLGYQKSGTLSGYLENLIETGFVTRDFTWLLKNGKEGRLSHYRLSDNYLRFYLKYIEPNLSKIKNDQFEEINIQSLPEWRGVMGLQFENLVLNNRKKIWEYLNINPEDIVANNPFFQRKTAVQKGCQIDYLIQTRYNSLFACEVKFMRDQVDKTVIDQVKEKLSRLSLPRCYSCVPVLIHVNGVSESVVDSNYFAKIIDFAELLNL